MLMYLVQLNLNVDPPNKAMDIGLDYTLVAETTSCLQLMQFNLMKKTLLGFVQLSFLRYMRE